MTRKQIEWASQHDWFVGKALDSIVVRDRVVIGRTGECIETQFTWTGTFRELLEWAGY